MATECLMKQWQWLWCHGPGLGAHAPHELRTWAARALHTQVNTV